MAELARGVFVRPAAVASGNTVLEEHFELRSFDCEDSECVVEFEGILDIQAGNVAGSFVCREIGLGGLQSSVCTGAADGVSDAAAVL